MVQIGQVLGLVAGLAVELCHKEWFEEMHKARAVTLCARGRCHVGGWFALLLTCALGMHDCTHLGSLFMHTDAADGGNEGPGSGSG